MAIEGSAKCAKWILFLFNLVFSIMGVALIVLGAVATGTVHSYDDVDSVHAYATAPVMTLAIGCIVFLISFLGCCGAAKESPCMLYTYAGVLGLIFILQMVAMGSAFAFRGGLQESNVADNLQTIIKERLNVTSTSRGPANEVMQLLEYSLQCCGADGFTDYHKTSQAPKSCCNRNFQDSKCPKTFKLHEKIQYMDVTGNKCSEHKNSEGCNVYVRGCSQPLVDVLKASAVGIATAAIVFGLFTLLGVVFAVCVSRAIRSGYVYA